MQRLRHLAIIMDGNGRWAKAKNHPRIWGHLRGARVVKKVIEWVQKREIKTLTLFAFSSENWARPPEEVAFLMTLLQRHLARETQNLVAQNIKFRTIGNLTGLSPGIRAAIEKATTLTQFNTGLELVFAVNYGGRQEIKNAFKTALELVKQGELTPERAAENFEGFLDTHGISDPDLVLRTSGEMRLSNFLLWQSAYSEFYFTPVLWPDFKEPDLDRAISSFEQRQRRFGAVISENEKL